MGLIAESKLHLHKHPHQANFWQWFDQLELRKADKFLKNDLLVYFNTELVQNLRCTNIFLEFQVL